MHVYMTCMITLCSCEILFAWRLDGPDMITLFACFNGSVLAAVNGLKLRAPHLTTGIVMLKATYYVRIIVECIYFARIYNIV